MPDSSREPILVSFGAAVRQLRSARGWSQEELADRAGIHRTYLGDVERGRRNIGLVNIGRIVTALETNWVTLGGELDQPGK
jgi:transcriptional regulator with XRE-family HTH domain